MYSVVLMAALTAGTATPAFGNRTGFYSSYPAYGGYGCGCGCGGAWTFGGYGFAGGGYGYHGGCYGAGGGMYTDFGFGCTGCYGCHGGYSGYGIPVPIPAYAPAESVAPLETDPFPPINPQKKEDKIIKLPEEVKEPKESKPKEKKLDDGPQGRGKIHIEIPEGAKLYVDGKRINVPAGSRMFQTPLLTPGQKYFYDIRLEIERNGQIANDERRVIIEAGQNLAIAFPNLHRKGTAIVKANE